MTIMKRLAAILSLPALMVSLGIGVWLGGASTTLLSGVSTLLFSTRISMANPAPSYATKLERTQFNGWHVYRLTNGLVALYIAPELGGRAIQLELGDQGYFFVNADLAGKVLPPEQNNPKAGWANYGGDKVWPAPEGWMSDNEWPSIPYYILDGSKFDAEVISNNAAEVAVRVTSPKDPRTGVQFVRTFHVYAGTTRVKVEQVMRNISRRPIRWGIWHLIQHEAADTRDPSKPNPELYMYVPLNPHSMFPEGYYKPYGDVRHPSYEVIEGGRMLRIHYLYRVGKVGVDSNAGWYAVVNGQKNLGLVETFKYFPGAEYPDNASIESWNDGPGRIARRPFDQTLPDDPKQTPYFLESEVLSPYAALDPGEEYSFPVYWSPTRVTNPVRDATSAGAISEPLTGKLDSGQVKLTGVFGVFTPGTLAAVFYSAIGEELAEVVLQAVDPREVVRLDKSVPLPEAAFRVSLIARDPDGENRGVLGNVILK
jgi:hypothetical protein